VAPGTFDPPGDIEGFDAGGPPNITPAVITGQDVPSPAAITARSMTVVLGEPLESIEVTEFVEAARRHARATKTLKDLLIAIKAAKLERKVATAEFKKMMNPGRAGIPRVKKTRKIRVPAVAEV
jgi:hypothetical protein